MANPYLGEVRMAAFNYAPRGWSLCSGQLLAINQNQALFSLLGTFYGGNGTTNFALPNLQGRVPMHRGSQFTQGQSGGTATHTLITTEMPAHAHALIGTTSPGTTAQPANALPSRPPAGLGNPYATGVTPDTTLSGAAVGSVGGSQGHSNLAPYTVVNFIIALQGVFPSRN